MTTSPPPGEPDPTATSDAPWFHDLMRRIAAARRDGNEAEVGRLLSYAEREGGPRLRTLAAHAIETVSEVEAAQAAGLPPPRRNIGMNLPGERLCDFCSSPETVAYYPFTEFTIIGAGAQWASGDRMYVCHTCMRLVEASDWKGLRDWVGPAARNVAVRMLWSGFRQNRTGPAVEFPTGTDPEAQRDTAAPGDDGHQ